MVKDYKVNINDSIMTNVVLFIYVPIKTGLGRGK